MFHFAILGAMTALEESKRMRMEYDAYREHEELRSGNTKSFDEYYAIHFAGVERRRKHREALEVAERGRPRNFLETLLGG